MNALRFINDFAVFTRLGRTKVLENNQIAILMQGA